MKAVLALLVTLALVACGGPERTVERAEAELRAFRAEPTDANQAKVEKTLAELEARIERMRKAGDGSKAGEFDAKLLALKGEFGAAKVGRAVRDATKAIEGFGQAIKEAGKSFGDAVKSSEESP
jgi:uncharacterized protein YukE